MRGKSPRKRILLPDHKYNSVTVSKLINSIMYDGKKSIAEKIVYDAIEKLAKDSGLEPLIALEKAIGNVKPKLEVKSRRLGGANYQVPTPVNDVRQTTLAIRWIVEASRQARTNTPISTTLSGELMSAINGEGNAIRKKDDVHRMAEANKAFAHLAWQ